MAQRVPLPSFSSRRQWRIGLSVLASVLAVVAIVVMANYLAARHSRRFQVSLGGRFQLSPVTTEVLRSVTNTVKIIVFFDRTKPLYTEVADLLSQYQLRCPKLDIEYVDYERSPARARLVQAEYGAVPAEGTDRILFQSGGGRKVIYAKELSEYDYSALMKGKEVRLTGFKGEELFTSALYSLMDARPVKVCFLQGHNEHDPAAKDDSGYSKFVQTLQENQISVEKLGSTALLSGELPDCQLLVVAGPTHALDREELVKIEKYLGQGGRLLVLFRLESVLEPHPTGLEKLLADWGVAVGRNCVYDRAEGQADDPKQVFVNHFANHPVVNPLVRSRVLMLVPRSIGRRTSEPQGADAPKVTELASTSAGGMVTRPDGRLEAQGLAVPLLAAVERGAIQGIKADRGATRIVVGGDSHFLSNLAIDLEANRDFARNAVNWLLDREVLVQGIGSRPVKEYRISMTAGELRTVRWVFLAGFPGGVLFVGFLVWLRRRA